MSSVFGGVVSFDFSGWSTRYPEFSAVSQALAQLYFNEAALYCDNSACSPICDSSVGGVRYMILNMLTAHIAAINSGVNGNAASQLVGRIANATEGSVTVGAEMDLPPGSAQWFAQTKYGAAAWQAMAPYRTMHYEVTPTRVMDPWAGGFPPSW